MCTIEKLLTSQKLLSDGRQRVKEREVVPNPPEGGPAGPESNWEQAAWLAKN